jgi:hypothetical protein
MERHERTALSTPVAGKAVCAAFEGGRLTSDAGVPGLAEIERRARDRRAAPARDLGSGRGKTPSRGWRRPTGWAQAVWARADSDRR